MPKFYTCQLCLGYGGETMPELFEDGSGPWEQCWACKGEGKVTGPQRAAYLGVMSGVAREKRKAADELDETTQSKLTVASNSKE